MKKMVGLMMLPLLLGICSCTGTRSLRTRSDVTKLRFLGQYIVPYNLQFKNTTVGGLSGIDYDPKKKVYYLISDDRSKKDPARFYMAKIILGDSAIDTIYFVDTKFLKNNLGKNYPNSSTDPYHTPDPEALRYNPHTNELVWSSEGERIVKPNRLVLEDPSVTQTDTAGNYIDTFELPSQLQMRPTLEGPRQNEVFEGLDFIDHYKALMISVEEPLFNDGPQTGIHDSSGTTRFIQFSMSTRKPVAEFAYKIDPVAHPPSPSYGYRMNGVSDILSAGKNRLLVLERSYSAGRSGCSVKLYLADFSHAENILKDASLLEHPATRFITKELLVDMDDLGIYVDNIEGVTFGPKLPNGKGTLILVSDNNFSPLQKTQFLLFEIE